MNWLQHVRQHALHQPLTLPERYKDASLDTLPAGGLIQEVTRKYAENFWAEAANGIAPLYIGKARQYKTYAACALARLANRFITAEFVSYPAAFPMLELQRYSKDTSAQLTRWRDVPFLVLDDIFSPWGAGAEKVWARDMLHSLVYERFDASKPTVMTGNLALEVGKEWDSIAASVGPAFARRLQDASHGYRVLIL